MLRILVRRPPPATKKKTERGAKKSSPAAYSYLSATALDDLQHDYSTVLHDALSHASLRPPNLGIIPGRKAWLLTLDLTVLSDAGNIYDALFMAARAALCDTRVPRTRAVEYKKEGAKGSAEMDVDSGPQSALDTRRTKAPATDFELEDSWDDGAVLGGRDAWPLSVTLNLVHLSSSSSLFLLTFTDMVPTKFPGVHFLDATTQEEAAAPLRLILVFSHPTGSPAALHGMHLLGTGETNLAQIESLVKVSRFRALISSHATQFTCYRPIGWGKVCAANVHLVKRQVEGRGTTPDREGAVEVLRGTIRRLWLQINIVREIKSS